MLATRDRLGQTTVSTFDQLGRTTRQTDPNGATTKLAYDLVGNRTQLSDPLGNDTVWAYDGLNRPTTETNELAKVRTFFYDGLGRLRRKQDRIVGTVARATEYSYDNLDRLTQERWYTTANTLERTLTYGYDAGSRLTSASDPAASYTFTPDGLGRTVTTVATIAGLTSTVTLDAAYDSRSNRTQAAFKIGATADFKNTYQVDPLGRTTQIVQQGNGGNVVNAKRADFSYDAVGQFQKLSRYSDTAGTQLVAASGYSFDRLGRLTNLAHLRNSADVAGYRMAYDAAGRITRLDSSIDEVSQFSYDKRGQLTAADNTFEKDEAYAYDANGNRTSGGSVVQANNRLTSDATYSYAYDDEGNRTSRTHKVSGDKEEYAWDQRNRLKEVTFSQKTGPSTWVVTKKLGYGYDVFDRRVSRAEDATSPFDFAAPTEFFVYDGDDVALDFLDADGVGTGAAATLQKRYLHGPAVDQVLAQEDVTLATGHVDRVLWHLTDNLGSTRDLLRTDGTTKAHLQYDGFGNLIDGLESVTRYQFTGREHDPDSGLQYNRARWYDPQSGQWMSEDPIGFAAGDANLRRYVGNGPTNGTDPSGNAIVIGPGRPRDPYLDQLDQQIAEAPTGPELQRLIAERERYLAERERDRIWHDIQMGADLGLISIVGGGPTLIGRMFGWCKVTLGFADDAAKLPLGGGKVPGGAANPAPIPPAKKLPNRQPSSFRRPTRLKSRRPSRQTTLRAPQEGPGLSIDRQDPRLTQIPFES
jgi:RHS repeat-associated protein